MSDYYICFYKFNNVNVKVCFDSEQSKRLIDPKFKHLTSLDTDNFNVQFSVFKNQSKIFLFKNDDIVGSWNKTEMHEFQGKFSMEFLCSSYNNSEHDWMGVFHASTISKNNKFYVQSGAGIVADSVPEKEYQETVNKAKALMSAVD